MPRQGLLHLPVSTLGAFVFAFMFLAVLAVIALALAGGGIGDNLDKLSNWGNNIPFMGGESGTQNTGTNGETDGTQTGLEDGGDTGDSPDSSSDEDSGDGSETETQPQDVFLSAHRGAGYLAPENTLLAFQTTQDVELNSVEFDVQPAADGLVVIHDLNTWRTTGETLTVADTSINRLKQLDADAAYRDIGSASSVPSVQNAQCADGVAAFLEEYVCKLSHYTVWLPRMVDVRTQEGEVEGQQEIPTFAETLDFFQGTDMYLRIEFKGELKDNEELARQAYQMVESRGLTSQAAFMSFSGDCWQDNFEGWDLTSFNPDRRACTWNGLRAVEDASGTEATTAILYQKRKNPFQEASQSLALPFEYTVQWASDNNIDMVVPRGDQVDVDSFIADAKERELGFAFMGFPGTLQEQIEAGVTWVSTNNPDELKAEFERIYGAQ